MTNEAGFIAALKALATHPAARGLEDDCAVLGDLVITHDMIGEGVHFLPEADPADVAWRLVAVNLSDLAAAGAVPLGVVMGYSLSGDDDWDVRFVDGLKRALEHFNVPLLGGDTVRVSEGSARTLGLTAFGRAVAAPSRSGAKPGDTLWVTGTIGDAGAGLALADRCRIEPCALLAAYNRPEPRLSEGKALASVVSAMMDISDGLLIDARRMADASRISLHIALERIPLSPDFVTHMGGDHAAARITAATAGDDYELLFTMPADALPPVAATRIGDCLAADADTPPLVLTFDGAPHPLPETLGYQH